MQGSDCSTKSLSLEGRPPTRIPQYHKECLTEEEAEQILPVSGHSTGGKSYSIL